MDKQYFMLGCAQADAQFVIMIIDKITSRGRNIIYGILPANMSEKEEE